MGRGRADGAAGGGVGREWVVEGVVAESGSDQAYIAHGCIRYVRGPWDRQNLEHRVKALAFQIARRSQQEASLRDEGKTDADGEIQDLLVERKAYESALASTRYHLSFERLPPELSMWFDWDIPTTKRMPGFSTPRWTAKVPIWIVVVPTIAFTVSVWRLDTLARRRLRIGHCPTCNYNRHGIPAQAVCPECGALPDVPVPSTAAKDAT